ncbi:MAG: YfiR family protein [Nitrospinales bacterium]
MESKKYLIFHVFCMAIIFSLIFSPIRLNAQESVEYKVKAAFIHKFIKFTNWPQSAFDSKNSPVIIGVLGESPIFSELKDLENKPVRGRPLKIVKVFPPQFKQKPHIIFIGKERNGEMDNHIKNISKSNILTIGESDGFAEKGGMINFIIVDGKLRFEINIKSVEKSGLRLSSKLLRLGKIVKTN